MKKQLNQLSESSNSPWEYEALLIKEEAAIREHISYQHQLKLECDKLKNEIFEIELQKKELIKKNVILNILYINYNFFFIGRIEYKI